MIYIGIDPDIDNSGIACWDSETKVFNFIKNASFWDIIIELEFWECEKTVIIEAGWLIKKSNWHGKAYQSKNVGELIAKNVGSNHQVGVLLAEYCEKENIKYHLVKPKGKINSKVFKQITKHPGRTNQDQRDAAMLVFGY